MSQNDSRAEFLAAIAAAEPTAPEDDRPLGETLTSTLAEPRQQPPHLTPEPEPDHDATREDFLASISSSDDPPTDEPRPFSEALRDVVSARVDGRQPTAGQRFADAVDATQTSAERAEEQRRERAAEDARARTAAEAGIGYGRHPEPKVTGAEIVDALVGYVDLQRARGVAAEDW